MARRKKDHAGELCFYCKRTMIAYKSDYDPYRKGLVVTEEHKLARAFGGGNERENILYACYRCNNLRGHIPFVAFDNFARVVIKKYPNMPTPVLRNALNMYLMHLIDIALVNKRALNTASSLALLKIQDDTVDYQTDFHH